MGANGWMEDETMKTEGFERLRKLYAAAIQNLADRVLKAKSFAEVRELRDEFMELRVRIRKEDENLREALGFNIGRLIQIIDVKFEELGGPRAPME